MERKFYPIRYAGVKQEFAKAIKVGNIVFVSGMSGRTAATGQVASDDVLEQTEIAMFKIKDALEDIGLGLENVVRHEVIVKEGEDPVKVLRVIKDFYYKYAPILKEKPPAGTLWLASGLYFPDMKVEIEVTAWDPEA